MRSLNSALIAGTVATGATTAAALALGARQARTPWAALDATSHIAWGERATRHAELDAKHTGIGALLNAGAMFLWAGVHAVLAGGSRSIARQAAAGVATSALAYAVDYHVVPRRLTPGFERVINRRAVGAIYGVLALSLAAGGWIAALRK
jgi:hypothetical protein